LHPSWRISTEIGSILDQQFKVEDNDREGFDKSDSDGLACYGSLRVEYHFGRSASRD